MPTKQECDGYAVAVVEHFDEFVKWATLHWPGQHSPLGTDDFSAGRRELSALLGSRLDSVVDGESKADKDDISSAAAETADSSAQYVNMNPAPWP